MEIKMIIAVICHWLTVIVLAPFFIGVIAVVKAFFAGKRGPSVFQPYFDLIRLVQKNCVYSRSTTWVFRLTPSINVGVILAVSLLVPLGIFKAPVQFYGDIFLFVYLLALAKFFMILTTFDTGFSMEPMGASRDAFFSCFSETALFMNFITLFLVSNSLSLSGMIGADTPLSWGFLGPVMILVSSSIFIILLAENGRTPVDDPDTHLELTMIHEVMLLEYSGPDLAYMLYASAMKLVIFTAVLVSVVFPVRIADPLSGMFIFLGAVTGVAVLVGVIESCLARIRMNRVKHLLLIALALAFFALIVTLWRR